MILTLEQIKYITVGAHKVWQESDGIHFAKCTDKQIQAWYAVRDTLGPRAEATTGVRLDFITNSPYFAFKAASGDKYEIYIDNVLKEAYVCHGLWEEKNVKLDGNKHRITLVLPSHTIGVIESVTVKDGADIEKPLYDCKMLFVGDSITQGWNTRWDSLSYAYGVSRFFNAESVIQGIGGAMFHETTFDGDLCFEPDIICIAYGTNDWEYNETKEQFREHISRYMDKLTKRYEGRLIIGISPIWRKDTEENKPMGSFEECCNIVKEEYIKKGVFLVEGEYLVPHMPEFFDDGFLHPNDIGFGIYAQNLSKAILKIVNHGGNK